MCLYLAIKFKSKEEKVDKVLLGDLVGACLLVQQYGNW